MVQTAVFDMERAGARSLTEGGPGTLRAVGQETIRRPFVATAAVGWAATLLGTMQLAPAVWNTRILPRLGPRPLLPFVAAGGVALLLLAVRSWRTGPRRRGAAFAILAVVALAGGILLFGYYRGEKAAKRFHLVEYGVLSLLAFEAVRAEPGERRGIILAALFVLAVGTADEVLQGFVPPRTFRWLDLAGNWLASGLGAVAWLASSPGSPLRRGDPAVEE